MNAYETKALEAAEQFDSSLASVRDEIKARVIKRVMPVLMLLAPGDLAILCSLVHGGDFRPVQHIARLDDVLRQRLLLVRAIMALRVSMVYEGETGNIQSVARWGAQALAEAARDSVDLGRVIVQVGTPKTGGVEDWLLSIYDAAVDGSEGEVNEDKLNELLDGISSDAALAVELITASLAHELGHEQLMQLLAEARDTRKEELVDPAPTLKDATK